jgi:hypothetical protein
MVMTLTLLAITASAQIAPLSDANTSTTSPAAKYATATTPSVVNPPQTRINFKKGNYNDKANSSTCYSAVSHNLSASSRRTVL